MIFLFSYTFPTFCFPAKTPAVVHRNGFRKDCQELQAEVLRIVRFGSTGTTEPQKTSQDPLGRAQDLPNSPRGSPRSTPGTPEDHPRPPRHRSRAPKEPPWTPRTTGKSLFLPSLLPPPSLFPVPASLPPPSSLLSPVPLRLFCQPLLANQSVHQPWGSLQGAGGTGRQPLRYPPPQRSFCKPLDVKVRQLPP